jgi:hypothetical protein
VHLVVQKKKGVGIVRVVLLGVGEERHYGAFGLLDVVEELVP